MSTDYPLYFGIMVAAALGFFQLSIVSMVFEGSNLSMDPYIGIFGVFSSERFFQFLIIGIVTGLGS